MKIKGKEINLKITPRAIEKAENMSDLDILTILRKIETGEEPKETDYYKVVYAGYLGATNEDIAYEDFLKLLEDENISILNINHEGVKLINEIYTIKN